MPKGPVCPNFLFQQSGIVLTVITHKLLTVWIHKMNHWKAENVHKMVFGKPGVSV
jgi:hypothetical protein